MKLFLKIPKNPLRSSASTQHTRLLQKCAAQEVDGVLKTLKSTIQGLIQKEADKRLHQYGPNTIYVEKMPSWYKQLLSAFLNPFTFILIIIGLISFFVDDLLAAPDEKDPVTVLIIVIMILFSGLLHFFQEYRSNKAAAQLKKMVQSDIIIRRENKNYDINVSEIVPGEILMLAAGDMVPADCRIISSKDLFISESTLTGEAMPVEKRSGKIKTALNTTPLVLDNLCFMGTNVISGAATAIVVNTGSRTFFGQISKDISGRPAQTSFEKGVNNVSFLLIRFMLVMVPLIFLINGLTKGNWIEALLFAITLAVGLVPGMLPMIVTANLSKGSVNMSRKKVIVKHLNAIQNMGAMNILCTDKTGTITKNQVELEKHLNVMGREDAEVLKWAYLNSFYQTGLRNLMDEAVLKHAEVKEVVNTETDFIKLDEIPFDFERRRMSVILRQKDGAQLLICKGAVEEILAQCSKCFDPGADNTLHIEDDDQIPLSADMRENVLRISRDLNEGGQRVLLVAIKKFDQDHPINYSKMDESEMTLTGFIGFLDPAKSSAAPGIAALQELGVVIKVLTGDNELVTKKICREVGIATDQMMSGEDVEKISDPELQQKIHGISVFAKVNPMQKLRIVRLLRESGDTVGFLGDGINDAAALKEADVGISVDSAADIAKESADIILLEKDLMVLREGVVSGRTVFGNIIKYIKMATSSNFGNMFSMLGASALLPFLPMLPLQIIIQNLLYDFSQSAIPWDKMDKDFVAKPRKWDTGSLRRFMLWIGPVSSVFDYATFAVMYFVFKANTPASQSLFQTGWFVEGLLTQTLIVHIIRTKKIPFIQSWASAPLAAVTSLIIVIGLIIPYTPLAPILRMQPLPISFFPWLIAIIVCYVGLTQLVKIVYIRKYGEWL